VKSWSPEATLGWSDMILGALAMLLVLGGLLALAQLAARVLVRRWSHDDEFEAARRTLQR
jgi:hypothetical protein